MNSRKNVFEAEGNVLKITSLSRSPVNITGHCVLVQTGDRNYEYTIKSSTCQKSRTFKFSVDRTTEIKIAIREPQFQIVIRLHKETTQLIGTFHNNNDAFEIGKVFESIQKKSKQPTWLNAKHRDRTPLKLMRSPTPRMTPKVNTSFSVENQPHKSKFAVGLTPFSSNSRKPLSEKKCTSNYSPLFPSPQRQPSHGPSPKQDAEITPVKAKDDDPKVTAVGASRFYPQLSTSRKRFKRFTFKRTFTFQERNDSFKSARKIDLPANEDLEKNRNCNENNNNNSTIDNNLGFSNLGNTCYMNAILQCLLNIPNFFQDLNNGSNIELVRHNSLYNSLCTLGILKYSHETLNHQKYALRRVKNAVSGTAKRFSGFLQHDAHEFLYQCLDQLKDDLSISKKEYYEKQGLELPTPESENYLQNLCPVKENFESLIRHTILCQNCNERVEKGEYCLDFSLVIPERDENTEPHDSTINNLLKFHLMEELVEYTCDKCSGTTSTLSHQFCKLPRVIILHLKRYDVYGVKRDDRIILPEKINLKDYLGSDASFPRKYYYAKNRFKAKSFPTDKRKSNGKLDNEPIRKHLRKESSSVFDDSDDDDFLVNAKFNTSSSKTALQNNFTKVKDTADFDKLSSSDKGSLIKNDNDDFEFEIKDLKTVSDDEEEDLKKALELSLKEFEKQEREDYESLISYSEGNTKNSLQDKNSSNHNNDINDKISDMEIDISEGNNSAELCNTEGTSDASTNINGNENEHGDFEYKLVGIVNHHGLNTSTGHYTSDSYDFKSKKWRNYNDSSVKDIKEHEVRYGRAKSAYIVFYMHKNCFDDIMKGCCEI